MHYRTLVVSWNTRIINTTIDQTVTGQRQYISVLKTVPRGMIGNTHTRTSNAVDQTGTNGAQRPLVRRTVPRGVIENTHTLTGTSRG
jgi:hypothetical protein